MLSPKDRQILEALHKNSRQTVKDIARETGIPRTTVFERIKRMEKEGVIRGYTVRIDPEKLGLESTVFIMVAYHQTKAATQRELAKKISKMPGVEEVHIVAGEWDMIVKARGKNFKAIGALVLDKLRETEGVARTVTYSLFDTVSEEALP